MAAVLLQIMSTDTGKDVYHPIGFRSKKLSGSAACWDAHKREAFAVYYEGRVFSYHRCIERSRVGIDPKTLLQVEQSEVYIDICGRAHLQSFNRLLTHTRKD